MPEFMRGQVKYRVTDYECPWDAAEVPTHEVEVWARQTSLLPPPLPIGFIMDLGDEGRWKILVPQFWSTGENLGSDCYQYSYLVKRWDSYE